MSLKESLAIQEENFPIMECYDCGGERKPVKRMHPKFGITVWDYPMYECPDCGGRSFHGLVSVAVQKLQEKHRLHGGYYMKDLLEIEEREQTGN